MKSFSWVLFLLLANSIFAQTPVEIKYYNNDQEFKEVSVKKAGLKKETFIDSLDIIRHLTTRIPSDVLVSDISFLQETPIGNWVILIDETDEYFEYEYKRNVNSDLPQYNYHHKSIFGQPPGNITLPVFPLYENDFHKFIIFNLNFPIEARQARIGRRVIAQFVITEEGKVSDISIVKGVHPILDMEVVRLLRNSPDWEPAIVDGVPISVNVMVMGSFRYQ